MDLWDSGFYLSLRLAGIGRRLSAYAGCRARRRRLQMGGKPLSPHKASPAELHAQGGVEGAARLLQAVVVVELGVGQVATLDREAVAALR